MTELGKSAALKGKETTMLNNSEKNLLNKKGKETNALILRLMAKIHGMPILMSTHSVTLNSSVSSRNPNFSTCQPAGPSACPGDTTGHHAYHKHSPCHLIQKCPFLHLPFHNIGGFLGQRLNLCIFSD